MRARVIRLPASLRLVPAPGKPARRPVVVEGRGYRPQYHHGEVNHCPGCGRSQWWVGRASAECAFCATVLPFVGGESNA